MKEIMNEIAQNRERYKDYPRKKRMRRVDLNSRYWLYYAQVFIDNKWQEVLWKAAQRFGWKKRPTTTRCAVSKDGRCLHYREWALLKNVDYIKLANLLDNQVSLEDAIEQLGNTEFKSKVNLFVPKCSIKGE